MTQAAEQVQDTEVVASAEDLHRASIEAELELYEQNRGQPEEPIEKPAEKPAETAGAAVAQPVADPTADLRLEIAQLKQKLSGLEGSKREEVLLQKEAELAVAYGQLRRQRLEALREGDDELVISIEDRMELIKEQKADLRKPVQASAGAVATGVTIEQLMQNPVVVEWIEDGNAWFGEDANLASYAIAIGDSLMQNGETLRGRAFLDKVAERVRQDFPRRFRKTGEAGPSMMGSAVGSGSSVSGASSGSLKTARDLPPEDRKLMYQFIEAGWTTEKEFLKQYFESNG